MHIFTGKARTFWQLGGAAVRGLRLRFKDEVRLVLRVRIKNLAGDGMGWELGGPHRRTETGVCVCWRQRPPVWRGEWGWSVSCRLASDLSLGRVWLSQLADHTLLSPSHSAFPFSSSFFTQGVSKGSPLGQQC